MKKFLGWVAVIVVILIGYSVYSSMSFRSESAKIRAQATNSFDKISDDQAIALAQKIRQPASETEHSMAIVVRMLATNSDDTVNIDIVNTVTTGAGELATMGIGDIVSNTTLLTEIFEEWGVTTAPEMQKAMDDMWAISRSRNIPFIYIADAMKDANLAEPIKREMIKRGVSSMSFGDAMTKVIATKYNKK